MTETTPPNFTKFLHLHVDSIRHSVLLYGAVNNKPTTVAVYITLAHDRRAVAKFSKSRVWDKVPEGSKSYF